MEKFPDKVSHLLEDFSCQNCKRSIKRLSKRRLLLTKTGTGCNHLLCMNIVLQYTLRQGKPPHPPVYNMKTMPHIEVKVPSMRVLMKAKLNWT